MRISVDDYSDVFCTIPQLCLSMEFQRHHSPLCNLAKQTELGLWNCVRNKRKVVGFLKHRGRSMCGMCHMGLSECVEPIMYHDRLAAVLYFGPFVVVERLAESRRRLHCSAATNHMEKTAYDGAFAEVTHVAQADLPQLRQDARQCRTIIEGFIAAINPPIIWHGNDRYNHRDIYPDLVMQVMRIIQSDPTKSWSVKSLADRVKCHPNHLGRTFQQATGEKLIRFVHSLRIDRAKALLQTGRFSVLDVAYMCGFEEISHFSRTFRSVTGMPPGAYAKLCYPPVN